MAIQVSSTTPGVTIGSDGTVTCPTLHISSDSGTDAVGCSFTIASIGTTAPAMVTATMTADSEGGNKFSVYSDRVGYSFPLTVAPQLVGSNSGAHLPWTENTAVSWGSAALDRSGTALGMGDVGTSITLSYAIVATP
jgi:hypothetical protein